MTLKLIGAAMALVAGLMISAGGAAAHDDMGAMPTTPGGKAAYARHENYKQVGGAFKAINDELKKDAPSSAVLVPAATKLKDLAAKAPSWFPKGSGAESGFKTAAKPEIWSDAPGFAAALAKFSTETTKLQQFAAANDIDGMKGQVRATGGACKGCHDNYRVPEQH